MQQSASILYADRAPKFSTHPAVMLARESSRRFAAATDLDSQLAALEYGKGASDEAKARTLKVLDRILPELPAVNGYYDPAGFVAGSRRKGERSRRYKELNERILWKIIKRDGLMTSAIFKEAA